MRTSPPARTLHDIHAARTIPSKPPAVKKHFTKRHYLAIAHAYSHVPDNSTKWEALIILVKVFEADNPLFDRWRFQEKCKYVK